MVKLAVEISTVRPQDWRTCTRPGWRTRRLERSAEAGTTSYFSWDPSRCRVLHFLAPPTPELQAALRARGIHQVEGSPHDGHQLWVEDVGAVETPLAA